MASDDALQQYLSKQAGSIARSIREFSDSDRVFSDKRAELVRQYDKKWVGVYRGEIAAAADTFEALSQALSDKNIPLRETAIRKIDQNPKTLIL